MSIPKTVYLPEEYAKNATDKLLNHFHEYRLVEECVWRPISDMYHPMCTQFDDAKEFFANGSKSMRYCPYCGGLIKVEGE